MKKNKLLLVIVLNMVIVFTEITFGVIGNSIGLIADALHNLSDVLAVIIAYIAIVYSEKKVTKQMTFGYVRSEMMAGFLNSLFLIGAMFYVVYHSVMKLYRPEKVEGIYMIAVAGVAVVANALSVLLLKGMHSHSHSHSRKRTTAPAAGGGHERLHGHEGAHEHMHEHGGAHASEDAHDRMHEPGGAHALEDAHDRMHEPGGAHASEDAHEHMHEHGEDLNIKAATLHLMSDVAISAAVIIGGVLIYFWDIYIVDPLLSIGFSIVIVYNAFGILRDSFFSLMDRHDRDIDELAAVIQDFEGVVSVHGLHLTHPSSKDAYFSAHVVIPDDFNMLQVESLMEAIRERLESMGINHTVLQPVTVRFRQSEILCNKH